MMYLLESCDLCKLIFEEIVNAMNSFDHAGEHKFQNCDCRSIFNLQQNRAPGRTFSKIMAMLLRLPRRNTLTELTNPLFL